MNPTKTSFRITLSPLMLAAALALGFTLSSPAATVIVPGTANPWLAGITTNGFVEASGDVTPDESPVLFTSFTAGEGLLFTASGSAGYQEGSESGPPGVSGYPVVHGAEDGIGEIDGSPANALIAVFLDDSQPDAAGSTPDPLDFTSDESRNYLVLRPALLQPFYIGSGTTANGLRQTVFAPANATRLYLGIQDGFGWYNNTGSFSVDITQAQPLPDFTSVSVNPGGAPIRPDNPWVFTATYPTLVSGLRLRVQSTTTTNIESSWTDLPGNPQMYGLDGNYTCRPTADVPAGVDYFRIIASAPGYVDRISAIQGPFTVTEGISPLSDLVVTSDQPYRNSAIWVFDVAEAASISDLTVRVQFTANTNNEISWTDLPGGSMSLADASSGLWLANTHGTLPTGTNWFRAVAAAPSYPDRISAPTGPYTIGRGLGYILPGDFQVFETGTPIRSSNPWTFQARFTNLVSGLRLRVQSTTDTNSESSWNDLPGNPFMTMKDYVWTLNSTDVPANNGEYFRVIASAPGYVDETTVANPVDVLPGMAPLYNWAWHTTWPLQTGTPWVFTIDEASVIPGLKLRVQSSMTPMEESSWTDLPGGGQMSHEPTNSVTWGVTNSLVPAGNQYFRVIASADTYQDLLSVPLGVIIGNPKSTTSNAQHSGKYALENFSETQNPVVAFFQNIGKDIVHFFFSTPAPKLQSHVVVGAPSGGSADLTVAPGQKVTAPAVAATTGGTLFVGGEIIGNASLISQDGGGIVAQGGGNLISQDGGGVVSNDGGTAISHDGASAVSHDGGSLTYPSGGAGGSSLEPTPKHAPKGGPTPMDGPIQPAFTGLMTIDGDFDQYAGTVLIAIAGTNTLSQGAQQFNQLVVGGTASLLHGALVMQLFNPENQTNQTGVFQPPAGATFDLVVASNLVVSSDYIVTGPIPGSWSIVTRPDGRQALRLTVASTPLSLTLQSIGSALQLSYPADYPGYDIQSTWTLSPPSWTTFSMDTNVVTLNATNAQQFFRLSKP